MKDLLNQKFGKLTVVERLENDNGRSKYLCNCDCGNTKVVSGNHLKNGGVKSCGCLRKELASLLSKTRHTLKNSKNHNLYVIYDNDIRTLPQWCKTLKLNYSTMHNRIVENNWDTTTAFETPLN